MKIQTKLTFLLIVLSVGILIAAGLFSITTLDDYFHTRIIAELKTYSNEIEYTIRTFTGHESALYERLQELAHVSSLRLTLIKMDGEVIFESDLPKNKLATVENHLLRPEVQEAFRTGFGTTTRHSTTLNIEMLYLAKNISNPFPDSPFHNAKIIRVGIPLTQVNDALKDIQSKIIMGSILVLMLVVVLSLLISKKVTSPIREMARIAAEIQGGSYEKRIPVHRKDELGNLGDTLNNMIEKLNEDIIKLKKLERMRSEFLGNVSHEIRTPVFAIQGMLETLLNGAIEDESARGDFVERALANTLRLNTLLNDLIEISRIETGDMKMSFRYFSLQEFLNQVIIEMNPVAKQNSISLILEDRSDKIDVFGDKDRLKQVMTNLINNAIKYNKPDGIVKILFQKNESDVIVSVKDSGVGIAAEHQSRIFERFYRVDKERSREAGGTGLGLSIAKHIIEAHGSKIELQSEIGAGSTFSFALKR